MDMRIKQIFMATVIHYIIHHHKNLPMLYFLIKTKNELQICPVHPENEPVFRLLYEQHILSEGVNVSDVLRRFEELPVIISDGF